MSTHVRSSIYKFGNKHTFVNSVMYTPAGIDDGSSSKYDFVPIQTTVNNIERMKYSTVLNMSAQIGEYDSYPLHFNQNKQ